MRDEYIDVLVEHKDGLLDGSFGEVEFCNAWKQIVAQLPDDDTRELGTAIHEAGHAVMCWLVDHPFESLPGARARR